jgi:diguanylate cyclase (GGDEF)-like protein
VKEPSARSLTFAYVLALAIIASLSLASHLALTYILAEQSGAAAVINVAGKQRMLSQQIAGLSAARIMGMPVQRELTAAIDAFEASHRDLMNGNSARALAPMTAPNLVALYSAGDQSLDRMVRDFVARTRRIASLPIEDPSARDEIKTVFKEATGPLLVGLDRVVSLHQKASEDRITALNWMHVASIAVLFATLVCEALLIFRPMVQRIAHYVRMLAKMAAIDPLTGALNRRSFNQRAYAELSRAARGGRATSLLMVDADHFKAINDRFGHAGGDAALTALVAAMTGALRPTDLVGRYGGEEFAVLLPETSLAGAMAAAERIRATVMALEVPWETGPIRFTVSLGVSECPVATDVEPEEAAFKTGMARADAALYKAKAGGRNRVAAGAEKSVAKGAETSLSMAARA